MKQLVCEICGSTDIVKQNGIFVCQGCGVKYASEDVKKLLVDVPETVAVTEPVAKSEHTPEPVPQSQSNASPTPPAVEVPTPAPAPAPKKKPSAIAIVLSCIASVAFNLSALTGYYVFLAVILLLGIYQGMTNPLFHMYGDWETSWEATCANEGQQVRVCNVCGERETRAIPVLEHDVIILEAVEATCTSTGLSQGKTCSDCGAVIVPQVTIPLSHITGDWIIEVAPTMTEEGKCYKECTLCHAVAQTCILDPIGKGFVYEENASSCEISGYEGNYLDIVIPETFNGKPVTSISDQAFSDCDSLTSITIPNSVTSIGFCAFICEDLQAIYFKGTIAEWNAIEFHESWNFATPVTEIVCSDGTVPLD